MLELIELPTWLYWGIIAAVGFGMYGVGYWRGGEPRS